ncbi:hypothetical protein HMPREF3051_05590 [Fusobacterium sp. HMSC064B11]|uniref:DUF3601 domain-containing protein n=1 Tax=Fusobacterium nucleatum subsp. polymorphum TaxID=76857 RepID=A0A241PYZ5_FUSNP|nr:MULTISPECIES: DUF3601 domain-containing protein [Fusobacterium]ASG27783.1 hypothetical protein CBG61_01735 [Fusobacterium polymorphum]OFO29896.1 hypothetical protein HMPREF3051_05590 [Fusobacterium sp. HMSC064B11]
MSKIISILPFVFIFIGVFMVVYIMYTTIFEKRRKKMKNKEMNKLRETLSPYEFESTQQNANNKRFRFMEYLYSGDYVKVIKDFKDYYGFTHQEGEKFYFACAYFLPYEDGYTLYISKDKINIKAIYLQDRPETQREICYNLKKYFEIIEQGRFKR